MSRIFISYSRVDEVFARRLAKALSNLGADVWIDIEDIPTGEKWSRAIQNGLDTAQVMLVIISPDSMGSSNVEDEWQYYLDHGKPVIPIWYRPTKMHFQLNRIQYIDFHHPAFERAFGKLCDELAAQGINLNPSGNAEGGSARPSRFSVNLMTYQPLVLSMSAALLVVLVVSLVLLVDQLREGEDALKDDPVANATQLLEAMSARNFGIAEALVCEGVSVQENAVWGKELRDIACHSAEENRVACSFRIDEEAFLVNFIIDTEKQICGQN